MKCGSCMGMKCGSCLGMRRDSAKRGQRYTRVGSLSFLYHIAYEEVLNCLGLSISEDL
jgi:hypothetical protein